MEQVNVLEELSKDNPDARVVSIHIMADALAVYEEASDNVRRNGAIVSHPRTGAPIENPYIKIANTAAATVRKLHSIKSDRVALLLREYYQSREQA